MAGEDDPFEQLLIASVAQRIELCHRGLWEVCEGVPCSISPVKYNKPRGFIIRRTGRMRHDSRFSFTSSPDYASSVDYAILIYRES